MAYSQQKSGDIIITGFETGIATSPYKGIANIQGGNISTETGEVLASFTRTQQLVSTYSGGTFTASTTGYATSSVVLVAGIWIQIGTSTISGLSNGAVYYLSLGQAGYGGTSFAFNDASINSGYSYAGAPVTLGLTGTATFTIFNQIGTPVAQSNETYYDLNNVQQYRYYLLDALGQLWVYDTAIASSSNFLSWFLPYRGTIANYLVSPQNAVTGMTVYNGWIAIFGNNSIYWKSTSRLGDTPIAGSATSSAYGSLISSANTKNPHYAYVGHQNTLYYTDGRYIGSIFANTSLIQTAEPNIQSYWSYSGASTVGTTEGQMNGSFPTYGNGSTVRIPAVFWAAEGGSVPTALSAYIDTIVYIKPANDGTSNFSVYAAASGGSALDLSTGASGYQYFNTFYPAGVNGSANITSGYASITVTPQALTLPTFEIATSIVEIGTQVLIGCKGNILYPWDQVQILATNVINLPENNVSSMIAVNNMAYVFCGYKGNIYITNGSTISPCISVPDYCAGIAGIPNSYIDPIFTWGGTNYIRGRIYFSILDQTSTKTGNCGGIWSFIPSNNAFIQQDIGLALRMENQNSYGTYSGYALQIIPSTQNSIGPQYFTAWQSTYSGTSYGIDASGTTPISSVIIETDLIPTGTFLNKQTFSQIEYKLSSPLLSTDSVSIAYRQNSTDAFVSCGASIVEATGSSTNGMSGYVPVNFQLGQWLQLQITLNPASTGSFCRLNQVIIHV